MPTDKVFRKGQYVLCRYHGNNGDLVAGRIESVRRSGGTVVLTNMLTGKESVKRTHILSARNLVVPKKEVDRVINSYQEQGKQAARKLAVSLVLSIDESACEEVRQVQLDILTTDTNYCAPCCRPNSACDSYCDLFDEERELSRSRPGYYERCKPCKNADISGKGVLDKREGRGT